MVCCGGLAELVQDRLALNLADWGVSSCAKKTEALRRLRFSGEAKSKNASSAELDDYVSG